jgi:hypothetical protein
MKVNHIGMRFFEDAEEAPRGVRQMLTHVRLYGETICSHPFAERAEGRYCEYAGVVALLSLQAAHLRDECLGPADLHAVNHMRNSHSGCLNLRQQGADQFSVSSMDRGKLLDL